MPDMMPTDPPPSKGASPLPPPPPSSPPSPESPSSPPGSSPQEKSPADKLIEAEGGEVIPDWTAPPEPPQPVAAPATAKTFAELKPQPAPPGTPAPAVPPKPVVIEGARPVPVMAAGGPRPPGMAEPPQESEEQRALIAKIDSAINFELNVLHMCYGATHNLVNTLRAGQPPDIAEFAQFSAEKRTPLELAEPQMALEVYRQVRENLRHAEAKVAAAPQPKDALSVIGEGLNDALVVLAGRKK